MIFHDLLKAPRIDIIRQPAEPKLGQACACFLEPENNQQETSQEGGTHKHGCLVCGAGITYLEAPVDMACHYCGRFKSTNALCSRGHFVCDRCHGADAVEVITQMCLYGQERDAVALMQSIRAHPRFGMHGPEHHALVPAVILAALRNAGHVVPEERILTAIQRGQSIPGGACAFLGACGAAVGAGIAVSLLLEATPYDEAQEAGRSAGHPARPGAHRLLRGPPLLPAGCLAGPPGNVLLPAGAPRHNPAGGTSAPVRSGVEQPGVHRGSVPALDRPR